MPLTSMAVVGQQSPDVEIWIKLSCGEGNRCILGANIENRGSIGLATWMEVS